MDVFRRRPARRHPLVLRARRNLEVIIGNQARKQFLPGRLLGEDQADHRTILLDLACRPGVVDLQGDLRAGGNPPDRARLPDRGLNARKELGEDHRGEEITAAIKLVAATTARELAAVVVNRHAWPHPPQILLGVKDRIQLGNIFFEILFGRRLPRYDTWRRRNNKGVDVVDDPAIAWARFGHLHVFVFSETGINQEVMVFVWPIGFEGELFRHLQDRVRLADAPPFDELRRRRQVARIALFGAAVNPGRDGVNLVSGQAGVV
jgi:hypothetical protein